MRNIPIGEWGAYIVLMYNKNSSCETKRETDTSGTQLLLQYTYICSQWDGMFTVHDTTIKPAASRHRKILHWGPLCVDPTFNLGAFYVTPTTYHNLLDETTRGNNPLPLGPILIHQTKTFRPFHYLASMLIQLNPQLAELRAFGTDGEPELIKAFEICFSKAVQLRCTNHLWQNVRTSMGCVYSI